MDAGVERDIGWTGGDGGGGGGDDSEAQHARLLILGVEVFQSGVRAAARGLEASVRGTRDYPVERICITE